jgi:16S rRNA (guanine(966)-N(2))-methyltransferase RsmD
MSHGRVLKSQPLRIGGGALHRRRLLSLPGLSVRPTSGRVRQALFNMLRNRIEDAIFVDLFAGTGSVGLEALSHGAKQTYFIEHDRRAVLALRSNIERCGVADRTTVIAAALPQALHRLPLGLQADILFLDPPYASDLAEITLAVLQASPMLAPHGTMIWQHAAQRQVPAEILGRRCLKRRRYGATQLSVFGAEHATRPEGR